MKIKEPESQELIQKRLTARLFVGVVIVGIVIVLILNMVAMP